jgi:hypothetical protein
MYPDHLLISSEEDLLIYNREKCSHFSCAHIPGMKGGISYSILMSMADGVRRAGGNSSFFFRLFLKESRDIQMQA